MRVLQVLEWFSPRGGGVSSVVYKLSKALKERGHQVSIYTTDFMADREFAASLTGVRVHLFRSLLDVGGLHIAPGVFRESKKSVRDFDIIHFHTYTSFINVVIARYAAQYGIPYVFDVHGNLPGTDDRGRKKLFHKLVGRQVLFDAKKLIAETQLGYREYINLGAASEKIVVIPPGFDTEELANLPSKGAFRSKFKIIQPHMILYLGRIHQIKGLDFLIEAFGRLAQLRDDVVLVIAGPDDGFQANLQNMIVQQGLKDKVIFAGFLSLEDKKAALVDASVFFQPSRYEQGVAWTTLEAILCGLPLVATGGTGAAEDIEKMAAGYIVEFGNAQDAAATMNRIIHEPTEALARNANGKEYIRQNLSLQKRVKDFEALYAECMNGNGGK
jgi:glycosyltransferase involved in cell wall biosynthesis